MAAGEPLKFIGINAIGLRRNKFSVDVRKELKSAYKYIYNSGISTKDALNEIKNNLNQIEEIKKIISFINNSNRGLIS
jgi:UDP-N-acetylglucosamine acyltransferase